MGALPEPQTPRSSTTSRAARLRAGDADREAVADRLRVAAGEGRISLAELDERVERAYSARTFSEL